MASKCRTVKIFYEESMHAMVNRCTIMQTNNQRF